MSVVWRSSLYGMSVVDNTRHAYSCGRRAYLQHFCCTQTEGVVCYWMWYVIQYTCICKYATGISIHTYVHTHVHCMYCVVCIVRMYIFQYVYMCSVSCVSTWPTLSTVHTACMQYCTKLLTLLKCCHCYYPKEDSDLREHCSFSCSSLIFLSSCQYSSSDS